MWGPKHNLGPIGSAVLTFIGYKQTERQAKLIYIDYYYCSWRDLEQSENMLLQFSPILDAQWQAYVK